MPTGGNCESLAGLGEGFGHCGLVRQRRADHSPSRRREPRRDLRRECRCLRIRFGQHHPGTVSHRIALRRRVLHPCGVEDLLLQRQRHTGQIHRLQLDAGQLRDRGPGVVGENDAAPVSVLPLLDQFGVAACPAADRAEHPDRLHRHRLIRRLVRFRGDGGGQLPQRRIEQHRVDAVFGVVGDLVGQHDLGALTVLLAGRRVDHVDVGHRVARPAAASRAGLDLNAIHVGALRKLCRDAGLSVQDQRPLDLQCCDDGCAEGLAGCGQRHLGEAGRRDDGPALNRVIGQPWQRLDTDVGLPHMLMAGRHLDVRAE